MKRNKRKINNLKKNKKLNNVRLNIMKCNENEHVTLQKVARRTWSEKFFNGTRKRNKPNRNKNEEKSMKKGKRKLYK